MSVPLTTPHQYGMTGDMKSLRALRSNLLVGMIRGQLDTHPELWNQHSLRTTGPAAYAHGGVSDIWVRYRDFAEWDPSDPDGVWPFVSEAHESVWYPAANVLTALKTTIFDLCREYEVERLGGVLITKIPAGGQVAPHIDRGWHATYYEKLALQIAGNVDQAFCFDDGAFRCGSGTLYTFDNSKRHWVLNESREDRITAIICVRRDPRSRSLVESG